MNIRCRLGFHDDEVVLDEIAGRRLAKCARCRRVDITEY